MTAEPEDLDPLEPPPVGEVIEIYLGATWLKDGVIRCVVKATPEYTLAHAQEQVEAYGKLTGGEAHPVLADIRTVHRQADRDARKYYASPEGARFTTALAIVVGSDLTRLLANFFFKFHSPAYPTRMFTHAREALAWLDQYRR